MKEKVRKLRDEGKSYKEIMKITGLSMSTISYHVNPNVQKSSYNAQLKKRKDNKLKLIIYKGGKCYKCGYDKCVDALEFHHRDPSTKELSIGTMRGRSLKRLKEEADKCDLLCSNCHREEHYRLNKIR